MNFIIKVAAILSIGLGHPIIALPLIPLLGIPVSFAVMTVYATLMMLYVWTQL